MEEEKGKIEVYGARVHNLKNVDVEIPHDSLTVITGLSGSGKSSLAFDTIFAEGQRRYLETFSTYARNFLGGMERPDVDKITGLSPVISIEQKTTNKNPRSTVGTTTEIYDYLRLLFSRAADAYSYLSGEKMVKYTEDKILELLLKDINLRLADKQLHCTLTPAAKGFIAENGYDPLYGARPLKRYLQSGVETALAKKIIGEELLPGRELTVDVIDDQLIVQ